MLYRSIYLEGILKHLSRILSLANAEPNILLLQHQQDYNLEINTEWQRAGQHLTEENKVWWV